jgi:hypothetical protein
MFSSRGVFAQYPWIGSVAALPKPKDRRFEPRREGRLWVIQLCPAFDMRNARESPGIPEDARGIYRYVREGGEIVYIGRGAIKSRLASPERNSWDFDVVEYSVVESPDDQVRWEAYWLKRYAEDHNGKLPAYNMLSGASQT